MCTNDLVEQFCTPPLREELDFDRKAFADAQIINLEFETRILKGFAMGSGRTVLLVHGWSSRASHLSLLARYLVTHNFRVLVFDMPAHGDSRKKELNDTSSMFEFGRALACITQNSGDVYAIIGHSLGATAAAFTVAGTGLFADYRLAVEKLILISPPESLFSIIENYCRKRNEPDMIPELTRQLENVFNLKVADYSLSAVIKELATKILIIHDEQDEEIPIADALKLKAVNDTSRLIVTKGYGHKRILINREIYRDLNKFLLETNQ